MEIPRGHRSIPERIEKFFRIMPEKAIARQTPPSSTPFKYYLEMYPLPNDLNGARILDIGAGFSSFTDEMLKRGADSYAVDPKYYTVGQDMSTFKTSLDRSDEAYGREELLALQRFEESLRRYPGRYRSDYASNLSFPDGYFDYIYSCSAVYGHLDLNPHVLLDVVSEIVRVSKDRVRIVFGPIGENIDKRDEPQNPPIRYQNRGLVETLLLNKGFTYEVDPYSDGYYQRVLISRG